MFVKKTIYVPDDLWERAAAAAGNPPNESKVVQIALRRYVELEGGLPAFVKQGELFDDEDELLNDLTNRYLSEARARYADAFNDGMKIAETLTWDELEVLAVTGWDIEQ